VEGEERRGSGEKERDIEGGEVGGVDEEGGMRGGVSITV